MQKKAYPIGKPDFRKRKTKDVRIFLVRNRTRKSLPRKMCDNSGKTSLVEKTDIRFHHLQLFLWEQRWFQQLHLRFFFCQAKIVIVDKMSFFYVLRFGIVVCFLRISVLRYLYAFKKVLGFCGWNFLVLNFFKLTFLQPQASLIWTLVSIFWKILWTGTLSDNLIYIMYPFGHVFVFFWDF